MKKKKSNKLSKSALLLNFILFLLVLTGIFLRTKCYIANPSLWHDECSLAWNVRFKSYMDLFENLRFFQIAPPMFLVSAKALLDVCRLGNNVLSVDLAIIAIPFASGLLSILAFYFVSMEVFQTKMAQIGAMILFVTNFELINYSCQFKQYSTDVLLVLLTIF